uniref:Ring finger protein 17 n=1 Tax=Scleropages formosus TaxID=113540 RepID=A0A8C9SN89_SCLFO
VCVCVCVCVCVKIMFGMGIFKKVSQVNIIYWGRMNWELSICIQKIIQNDRMFKIEPDLFSKGTMIFVKWKENTWCRAVLKEVFQRGLEKPVMRCPASTVSSVEVYFLDYGFSKQLSFSFHEDLNEDPIHQLNQCLRKVDLAAEFELSCWAPQAVRCSLKDIVPANLVDGWSPESCAEFQRVVGTKVVEMQVFGEESDVLLVDLKKAPMDESLCDMPVSLREYLVFMELARFRSPVSWNSNMVSCGKRPTQFHLPILPVVGMAISAVVCHANTPSDFYIWLVDSTELKFLNTELQKYYTEFGPLGQDLEVCCPVLEQACVAQYDDNHWYRAQVIGLPSARQVEVKYVDYGDTKTLSVKDIRKIKDEFLALPPMAIHCCLVDLEPLEVTWSQECKKRFQNIVGQKLWIVVTDGPQLLPVRLFDMSSTSGRSCNIGDLLVENGLASYKVTSGNEAKYTESAVWDPPLESHLEGESTQWFAHKDVKPSVHMDLRTALQLPNSMKDLRVRVTHVTSPQSIFVQLQQMDFSLKRVCEMLKEEYSESEAAQVEWKPKMYCAAYINGVWERGEVCSVSSSTTVEVLRCDFGSKVKLHPDNLRLLQPHLVGYLVLECSLAEIRPAGGSSTWTATACDFISSRLSGASAVITWPVPVVLWCSSGAGQDVNIADVLFSKGLALKDKNALTLKMLEEAVLQVENLQEEQVSWKPKCCTNFPEKVKKKPYLPPELPQCGLMQVIITAVGEDGVIYAMTRQAEQQFEQLQDGFRHHIKTLPRYNSYSWKSGLGCAIMGSDMFWYRGEVLEVIGVHAKVRYVDQGLVENIPVCHVYPTVLCEDVPQLCIPCQLHSLIPVGGACQSDSLDFLKELLHMRHVNMLIMELPVDPWGNVTVRINLDGMDLNRIMIHHQHAVVDSTVSVKQVRLEGQRKGNVLPDVDNLDSGENLEESLKHVNEAVDTLLPLTDFAIGRACLAKYSDGKYYRAELLSIEGYNPTQVLVRHVDYGSDDVVPTYSMRQIPPYLLKFPCKAIKVKVAGFKAPLVNMEKERILYRPEWSIKAMLEMIDAVHGNITASVVSTEPEMTVLLYNERGVLVHRALVEKGLADED